jgi:hypothetical protein
MIPLQVQSYTFLPGSPAVLLSDSFFPSVSFPVLKRQAAEAAAFRALYGTAEQTAEKLKELSF